MTGAFAKLRRLSFPAKIGLALTAAVVAGIAGWIFLGPEGALGVGGVVSIAAGWFAAGNRPNGLAAELADEAIERAEQDGADEVATEEQLAAARAKMRDVEARDRARRAADGDDGDTGRVYERDQRPGSSRSSDGE